VFYSPFLAPIISVFHSVRAEPNVQAFKHGAATVITPDSIQLIEIKNHKGNFFLNNYLHLNTDGLDPFNNKAIDQLNMACKDTSLYGKKVSFLAPSHNFSMKHLKLPVMPDSEIIGSIKFSEKDSMSFPIENASLSILPITNYQQNGSMLFLSAFLSYNTANSYFEFFQKTCLKLVAISTIPSALSGLLKYSNILNTQNTTPLIIFSSRETSLNIIHKKEIICSRNIPIGVDDLKTSYGIKHGFSDFNILENDDFSNTIRSQSYQTNETASTVNESIDSAFTKLVWEIERSISYFHQEYGMNISRSFYYLNNGIDPIGNRYSECFNIFAKVFTESGNILNPYNPFDDFLHSGEKYKILHVHGHYIAILVGLALDKGKTLNLLPTRMQYSIANISRNNLHSAVLFFYAIFSLLIYFSTNLYLEHLMRDAGSEYIEFSSGTTGSAMNETNYDIAYYSDNISNLNNILQKLPILNGRSLDYLRFSRNISATIPNNIALSEIEITFANEHMNTLAKEVNPYNILLKGHVRTTNLSLFDELNIFIDNLKTTASFDKISILSAATDRHKDSKEPVSFSMQLESREALW